MIRVGLTWCQELVTVIKGGFQVGCSSRSGPCRAVTFDHLPRLTSTPESIPTDSIWLSQQLIDKFRYLTLAAQHPLTLKLSQSLVQLLINTFQSQSLHWKQLQLLRPSPVTFPPSHWQLKAPIVLLLLEYQPILMSLTQDTVELNLEAFWACWEAELTRHSVAHQATFQLYLKCPPRGLSFHLRAIKASVAGLVLMYLL